MEALVILQTTLFVRNGVRLRDTELLGAEIHFSHHARSSNASYWQL
jgi:hypothetical protein